MDGSSDRRREIMVITRANASRKWWNYIAYIGYPVDTRRRRLMYVQFTSCVDGVHIYNNLQAR